MERVHAPLLMKPVVQAAVAGLFITGVAHTLSRLFLQHSNTMQLPCISLRLLVALRLKVGSARKTTDATARSLPPALFLSAAAIPRLPVGLDQAVALPRDSYLQVRFCVCLVCVVCASL